MSAQTWTSARVLGWVRTIAASEGLDPTLFDARANDDDEGTRVPLSAIEEACALLQDLVGGPDALLEAARRTPVSVELALTSTADTPAGLLAHYFDVLVPSLVPAITVTRARGPAGEEVVALRGADPIGEPLTALLGGIAAALPQTHGFAEASVRLGPAGTAQLSVFAPPAAALADGPRVTALAVGAVFTDLLQDRAFFQDDLQRGERTMVKLAQTLYEADDLFQLARRVAEMLATELALPFVLVWAKTEAGSPRLLATAGARTENARFVPLSCGDRHVGLIEASDTPTAHWLDALAPWIGAEIARYTEDTRVRVQPVPAPPASWGLTRRQREVAMMVATGASTNEIAARLGSSPRTIEEHVGSCLRKAGVANRGMLAARMFDAAGPEDGDG